MAPRRAVLTKGVKEMRKLVLITFALLLVVSLTALAQYGNQSSTSQQSQSSMSQQTSTTGKATAKAVTLSGKISDDGKTFVSAKDNKSWTISNPDAVKGHEGHEVKVKAHEDAAKNEIHVVSLTMQKQEMKK
jgi:membrane protein implicated in regulation of membrane protease activity